MRKIKISLIMAIALLLVPFSSSVYGDSVVGGVPEGGTASAESKDLEVKNAELESKSKEIEKQLAELEAKAKEAESKAKAAEAKLAEMESKSKALKPGEVDIEALIAQGGDAVIAEADRRHVPFKDETLKTQMTLNGGVHKDTRYVFWTYTKGTNRRAVRFEEPAEMRGMGVVIKGRSEVYARLPDSEKVRRVGTHSKRQSFYGSDWCMDDMSMISLGEDYTAKILDSSGSHIKLELKLRPGVDLPYPKLIIKVDKKYILVDYIEYYDDNGKYIKLQQRFAPKKFGGGFLMYSRVLVTDVNSNHTTENVVLEEKINQDIPDEHFTKRWLVRSL